MFRDLFQEVHGAVRHNRRRAGLTMLGMAWGIATVILLLAYGSGFGVAIENIFQNFGAKVIAMFPGRTSLQTGGMKAGTEIRLTMDDVDRLSASVPLIKHITPEVNKPASVQFDNRTYQLPVSGDLPAVASIRNLKPAMGRFFNDEDNLQHARVCVLSSEAKTKLFSGRYALGEHVRVDGISYQVIGVLEPKMQEGDDDINRIVYVPFNSMGDLADIHYLTAIWADYEGMDWEKIDRMIRGTLAAAHNYKPDDPRAVFVFNSMKQLSQFRIISMGLQVLLAFIGALTLGIGGVGVMNIMLVSVQQRTREIGVLKALGARKRHILFQFLFEALAISFGGGIFGVLISFLIAKSVGSLTLYSAIAKNASAGDIRLVINPGNLLVATGILIFVGVISGMVPAIRASRLDPIEALRYE